MDTLLQRPKEEAEKIARTLKVLERIFSRLKIEYRIFGSVLIAAILGRSQRRLGDIDLMVDERDKEKLFKALKKEGYRLQMRSFRFLNLSLIWVEAFEDGLLDLTIFFGSFDKEKNFVVKISNNLRVVAVGGAIQKTSYNFCKVCFTGIPLATSYYGALASRGNPKRKYDLVVFEMKKIKKPAKGYAVIDFYYRSKKLPFLYSLSCFLQDALGRVNLFLGGNYDFWRR